MNKVRVLESVFISFLIAFSLPIVFSPVSKAQGNHILYVGGSGPGNYSKIQDAVNHAVDGDTVFVYSLSSPYHQFVFVNRSISLIGENKDTTVIDTGNNNTVVYLLNTSSVQNFTIIGQYCGVFVPSNNSVVSDNILVDSYFSVAVDGDRNLVKNNYIVHRNASGYSVLVEGVDDIVMQNVIENASKYSVYTNSLTHRCTITKNIIHGEGIELEGADYTLENNSLDGGGNFDNGINLYGSNGNTIIHNVIRNYSYAGIEVYRASLNIITKNNLSWNKNGIIIQGKFNQITQNDFLHNKHDGFFYFFSFFNHWDGNYWERGRSTPYIIVGRLGLSITPWVNVDWHPARQANNPGE